MNRKVVLLAQIATTILLLGLLFRGFDWQAFVLLFRRLPPSYYFGTLAVVLSGQALYAWRWRTLLKVVGVKLPFITVLRLYFIGIFFSNFLPSTVGGDLAKVYYLGREHGYSTITASIVLDRMLGLALLAALASVTLWLEPVSDPRYDVARVVMIAMTAALAAVTTLSVFGSGGLPKRVSFLGQTAVRAATELQRLRLAMVAALRSPAVWFQAIGTIGAYFVMLSLAYRALIELYTARRLELLAVLMTTSSTAALSNVPITFNGLGLREQLHVVLLEPLGISAEIAVAISLLVFAHLVVASVIGALLWMRAPAISMPGGFVESSIKG